MNRNKILNCIAILLFLSSSIFVFGQAVNANLLGTVTDQTKASVPGATVTITEVKSGASKTTQTNASGNYDFEAIQPGTYEVTAAEQGFKQAKTENVSVVVNTSVRVDLTLALGSATESVTVSAAPDVLKTDRADVGIDISSKQAEDLPLGTNRNFQGLLALVPGATKPHFQHSTFFNAAASLSTEVNGQSRLANNTEIEGVDDNERSGLLQVLIPPSEAIQSVSVSTANYQAEFGRVGGAVTDVILKSGTNDFHGAAYEFNRVSALAAENYFQSGPNPVSTYNYYGGNVGGPIIHDKLFIFGDFLHVSDHQGQFNTLTVPTAANRAGDFSASPNKIYDPMTGNADGTNRSQFSYQGRANVIDPARISPIANKILALVPLPNVPGAGTTNNYTGVTHYTRDTNSFDVKGDENLRGEDHLSIRYSYQKVNQVQSALFGMAGGPAQGATNARGTQAAYNTAANYTHVFSPALLAELRLGLNHYRNTARNLDYGTSASAAVGIPGVNVDAATSGLASIDIGGYSSPIVGTSASYPWDRGETNIDVVNNWTKVQGNHGLKFGAEVRRVRDDLIQGQVFGQRGNFQYRDGQTALKNGPKTGQANDLASFLIDDPNQVGRDVGVKDASWRETQVFAYAQDTWQASSKLTLNYGLRWELYVPPTPRQAGDYSNYDPSTNSLIIAGIGKNPMNLGMKTRYTYFAPRLGFAYRMNDKTVVRGGYGMSYESYPDNLNTYATNYPLKQNNAFQSLSSYTQAVEPNGTPASMAAGFPAPLLAAIPANGIITNAPQQAYNVINLNWKAPYVESWNAAVQRALPSGFVLDVAYVGNVGVGQAQNYNLNAGLVAGAGAKGQPEYAPFGRTASSTVFKQTGSNYNSLQVKLEHRYTNGLSATSAYTYQKGLGFVSSNGSGVGGTNFYIDFSRNYSRLANDRTHTFVQSAIYEFPFGRGKKWLNSGVASWIAGGWQVSGVLSLETGTPFTVTASSASLNAPSNTQVANINGSFHKLKGIGTSNAWFDTSVFSQPTTAAYGDTGQNAYVGPGFFNLDASAFRKFPITERVNLELRGEAFSITNTPQFGNPSNSITNADFGHIDGSNGGATGNRVIELAGKVTF
ncbi:carboxypeptidase regulatory-like domain-containing protein [Edaphobacter sp. DSM 109919]|uniref:Carboxypeptidase regulatory-like domain-containing protein n=1 Tax=Edaphobacter paludis TaxID=3035702 RepID=A0AAU7CZM6_9BACT